METDFELIDRYQCGDESAFSALIERHQRLVYRLCWQYMGEHAEADDAAQDTFFKAFQHLRTFRRDSSFKTWLYQIAVNTCKNRQRVKTFEALPEQMPAPDAGNPFHTTLAAEKKALLSKLICRLPARQRDTVSLRLRDLGFDAIGALLGCTAGTAKVNYYHGRTSLRRMVQQ